jgi:two-component system, NtrC family, sensor kinase
MPSPSILALFAAAVFGPLAILFAAASLTQQYIQQDAERRALRSAELLREHALRVFDMYQLILGQVERRAGTMEWRQIVASRAMHEELRGLTEPVREANSVFYLAPTGRHWSSSRRFPMPELDASERDYFQAQRARPSAFFIGAPGEARLTGQAFFAVTRARIGADGKFDGVFAVSGDIDYFRQFYRGLRETSSDALALVREDGVFLVREPEHSSDAARLGDSSGLMDAIASAPSGLFRRRGGSDPVERLYGYARVGEYPVYVMYGLSMQGVQRQWRRTLTLYSIVTLLAMAMLLVAAELARRNQQRAQRAREEREEEFRLRELAEDGLRRAQRLEAIGRMTGGIAHDFNNLLQVLTVNIEVLRRRLARTLPDEVHQRPLAAMQRAASQGARLTRQLLSFSRRSSLQPRRVSLAAFLPELTELLHAALRSRIELSVELAPGTAEIDVDPDELELALLNLATNARDAMPDGGMLRIRASNLGAGTMVDGKPLASTWVALTVSDNGSGIPPGTLQNIFDPFFTTKPVGQGTGLGLSQVYGFVTQSGGRVGVQSAPGTGTTFTLLFPPSGSPGDDADTSTVLDGLHVLVVDDEPDTGTAVAQLVTGIGATARHARSGEQALELLAAGTFEVLLTDVRMPGMTGDRLAREAAARHPALAIVLMTAYADSPEVVSGAFDVVRKPVSSRNLLQAIRRARARGPRHSPGDAASPG